MLFSALSSSFKIHEKLCNDTRSMSYMGHLMRLVEILAKIRDRTSWHQENLGHLKKYVKGNGT